METGSRRYQRMRRSAPALALALLLGASVLVPFGIAPTVAGAAPAAAAHPAGSTSVAGSAATSAPAAARLPPPASINCQMDQPVYTPWGGTTSWTMMPPLPEIYYQSPCQIADPVSPTLGGFGLHDEVHGTYSSSIPTSGGRVRVPIVLPNDSANLDISTLYNDFNVAMVVSGDTSSVDNQSLAEVYLIPSLSGGSTGYTYFAVAAVWSLRLTTGTSCNGQFLTWNNSYACEQQLLGGSGGTGDLLLSGIEGGDLVNVTFVGTPLSLSQGLTIYVNDSAQGLSNHVTLDSATTGGPTLAPAFDASCAIDCFLNWSQGTFGLSFGADLCAQPYYSPSCNSYDGTESALADPVTLPPPEFWNGTNYSGEYSVLATSSLSGDCQGSNVGCTTDAMTGFYPDFSFNGTVLNFGSEPPWEIEDFGGPGEQFETSGTATDFNPEWILGVTNDSAGSYVAGSDPITVRANVAALGNFTGLNVSYILANGQTGNSTMSRIGGSASYGNWSGQVPGGGGPGLVTFRVWATDRAGAIVRAPNAGEYRVTRVATLPTFSVGIVTSPAGCGGIYLNGTFYTSGETAAIEPGTYPLVAELCYPYIFGEWTTTKGASTTGAATGTITITSDTNVTGVWTYIRPHDTVNLAFSNDLCGTIDLNGTAYAGGPATISLLNWGNYSIRATACGGYGFSGWKVEDTNAPTKYANLTILGDNLLVLGNGTITLTVIALSGAVTVTLLSFPGDCGGILIGSAAYTNDTDLYLASDTAYPIHQDPCAHYGFVQFNVSAGITVGSGLLTATTSGTVLEENYHLTEVLLQTAPANCGAINFDGVLYTDGTLLNLTANTYHTAFAVACTTPLYHFVGFSVAGGVTVVGNNVTVNSSGNLTANFQPGPPTTWLGFETSPTGCGGILFEGKEYVDSNYTYVSPYTVYTITGVPCAGFGFVGWYVTGGVTIVGTSAYVNSSGSARAIFHPLEPVSLFTSPASCGSIGLNGVTYTNGAVAQLPVEYAMPLSATPCAGYGLVEWKNSSDGLIGSDPGTLTILAATYLTAVFAPLHYAVEIGISPAACGGLLIGGAVYYNDSTLDLLAGVYPVAAQPCTGYWVANATTTGGVAINGTDLTVSGSGALAITFGPVPPTLTLSAPGGEFVGYPVALSAHIAVPVPPFDYTYHWAFGDGATQSTAGNLTSHAYAAAGVYVVKVTVVDPFGREANATVDVTITAVSPLSKYDLTLTDWGIIVGTIVLVAVLVLVGRRRDRPPAGETTPEAGGPAAPSLPPADGEPVEGDFAKVQEPPDSMSAASETPTTES